MPAEPLIYAFHDDRLYTFERAGRHSASVFGGPLMATVTGQPFGPKPLHVIACLGGLHIPALNDHHLVELPLLYGLHYGGCRMRYRVTIARHVEMLQMTPAQSADDWPYPNFPPLLPFVPLRLSDAFRHASYDEFAAPFPNLPARQSADLMVAVPPPATLGVSLWGCGDDEGVTILFECDLKTGTVNVSNVTW
jgi:hypothetical protein